MSLDSSSNWRLLGHCVECSLYFSKSMKDPRCTSEKRKKHSLGKVSFENIDSKGSVRNTFNIKSLIWITTLLHLILSLKKVSPERPLACGLIFHFWLSFDSDPFDQKALSNAFLCLLITRLGSGNNSDIFTGGLYAALKRLTSLRYTSREQREQRERQQESLDPGRW